MLPFDNDCCNYVPSVSCGELQTPAEVGDKGNTKLTGKDDEIAFNDTFLVEEKRSMAPSIICWSNSALTNMMSNRNVITAVCDIIVTGILKHGNVYDVIAPASLQEEAGQSFITIQSPNVEIWIYVYHVVFTQCVEVARPFL